MYYVQTMSYDGWRSTNETDDENGEEEVKLEKMEKFCVGREKTDEGFLLNNETNDGSHRESVKSQE